jgi:hypothetical protein
MVGHEGLSPVGELHAVIEKRAPDASFVTPSPLERHLPEIMESYNADEQVLQLQGLMDEVLGADHWAAHHGRRVGAIAEHLAVTMDWRPEDIALVRRAGLMHDIGKVGVPLPVLDKPGPLDREELKAMDAHTYIGFALLWQVNLQTEARIMVAHHEHQRYPTGRSHFEQNGRDRRNLNENLWLQPFQDVVRISDRADAICSFGQRPYKNRQHEELEAARQEGRLGDTVLSLLTRDRFYPNDIVWEQMAAVAVAKSLELMGMRESRSVPIPIYQRRDAIH